MLVIWIDPSSSNIWLCIMDSHNVEPLELTSFRWKTTHSKDQRLLTMIKDLTDLLQLYNKEDDKRRYRKRVMI